MENSNEIAPLFASNEVMGTFLSARTQFDQNLVNDLEDDPKMTISSLSNCDLLSVTTDIRVVENSENAVHLILPYYSLIDVMSAEAVADVDMDIAGGFEIIFAIIGAIVTACAAVGGAMGIGSAGAGALIGSSIAAGTIAGASAAGFAGGGAAIAAGAVVIGTGVAAGAAAVGGAVGVGVHYGTKGK